jgi:hypothetical protein
VRGAMEWAQVRALAADGVSQREIARRLGDRAQHGAAAGRVERAAALLAGAGGVDVNSIAGAFQARMAALNVRTGVPTAGIPAPTDASLHRSTRPAGLVGAGEGGSRRRRSGRCGGRGWTSGR